MAERHRVDVAVDSTNAEKRADMKNIMAYINDSSLGWLAVMRECDVCTYLEKELNLPTVTFKDGKKTMFKTIGFAIGELANLKAKRDKGKPKGKQQR